MKICQTLIKRFKMTHRLAMTQDNLVIVTCFGACTWLAAAMCMWLLLLHISNMALKVLSVQPTQCAQTNLACRASDYQV